MTPKILADRHFALVTYVSLWILVSGPVGDRATAACKDPLSYTAVSDFLAHPSSSLSRFSHGGDEFAALVRRLAPGGRPALKALQQLILRANRLQKHSIGLGLEAAAVACLPRDGEIAKEIADAIKASGDPDVIDAYLARTVDDATSDLPIAREDEPKNRRPLGPRARDDLALPPIAVPPLVEMDRADSD